MIGLHATSAALAFAFGCLTLLRGEPRDLDQTGSP
jgi:hypothetical protein